MSRSDRDVVDPASLGFDPVALDEAVRFAETAETPWPVDLSAGLYSDPNRVEPAPWGEVIGPTKPRGRPNGVVVRGGAIAATWGDTRRVDMTFSVAKSYLAIVAGVAVTHGLIADVHDPVAAYALDDDYLSAQNAGITWHHLLQQTSEWEGTLFGKPDLVDRNRQVGAGADNTRKGTHRALRKPGECWEYNDVRVNRLSLSLLQVLRRPLCDVLAEFVMRPIGTSDTWEWHPYDNAWVDVEGQRLPSVPGGSHWGGGLFIHSEDHARLGWLVRSRGRWGEHQLIDEGWFDQMFTPCSLRRDYGYLWWLNTDRGSYPSLPDDAQIALGAGTNLICVVPSLDLVVVARWIDQGKVDELLGGIVASIR